MSLSDINTLWRIAEDRVRTKEGQKQMESEQLEDELEAANII